MTSIELLNLEVMEVLDCYKTGDDKIAFSAPTASAVRFCTPCDRHSTLQYMLKLDWR